MKDAPASRTRGPNLRWLRSKPTGASKLAFRLPIYLYRLNLGWLLATYASSYSWLILTVSCSETLPVVLDGGDNPPGDRDDQRQKLDPRADQYSKPARIEQVAQRAACEEPDEQKQPRERADNRDPPPRQ